MKANLDMSGFPGGPEAAEQVMASALHALGFAISDCARRLELKPSVLAEKLLKAAQQRGESGPILTILSLYPLGFKEAGI